MTYNSNDHLPNGVKENLSPQGQDSYRNAYNKKREEHKSSGKQHPDSHGEAHKAGWSASEQHRKHNNQ